MKPAPNEPKLPTRDEFYELANRLEWSPKYVAEEELFPVDMHGLPYLPIEVWAELFDAPYKVTYREYVKNQREKDQIVFAIREAASKLELHKRLDPVFHGGAFCAHVTAASIVEYDATHGELRMARFGKSGEWRNLATFGAMDEIRHGQVQFLLAHDQIPIRPFFAFAHKGIWAENGFQLAVRGLFSDFCIGANAIEAATQLTFAFETGFTNLQFVAFAAAANKVGDFLFATTLSSVQTDESRHAQIGDPVLKSFVELYKLSTYLSEHGG